MSTTEATSVQEIVEEAWKAFCRWRNLYLADKDMDLESEVDAYSKWCEGKTPEKIDAILDQLESGAFV